MEGLQRGRVIAISGEGASVDFGDKISLCSLKGLMKKKISKVKNIIAVGDWVKVSDEGGAIAQVEPRFSHLSRSDISGRKEQLIAVNIDQAIIIASIGSPPLKPALIDRYLIAANKGAMHPLIILNKIDLFETSSEDEKLRYREFISAYEPLGIPIVSVSTHTRIGIEALSHLLQGKTSVFAGQSGVGKSSLLNACFGLKLKTGDLAIKTTKGSHTTTTATLIPLPGGGYCVDTPGIRSFGVWKLCVSDLKAHFREITAVGENCRYRNCAHQEEPACAVLKALATGEISTLRYESYQHLVQEIKNTSKYTTWR